ncbi:MAG: cupin domain-containing protein [Bacteroidota bacterium]|jgi:quercetin dioxygenase-like cupin family protein|nr:cupin domain-containing protein [Cytophagales bacterium]
MNHLLKKIATKEVFPGFVGRFIHTQTMTFAFWDIKQGSMVPEHSHLHEQVVNMQEGEFELIVDGQPHRLQPGMVFTIPSHVKHSGRAITPCKILDVFSPVREDYKF